MNGGWVTSNQYERAYIDNMGSETSAIPEPSSLIGLTFTGIGWQRRCKA